MLIKYMTDTKSEKWDDAWFMTDSIIVEGRSRERDAHALA